MPFILFLFYLHNSINSSTISFPHWSESWLASYIPHFNCNITFSNLSHIKSNCRDHIFTELPWLQRIEYSNMFTNYLLSVLTAITLTKVVLPEYCKPTNVSSISSFQNRLLNQSRILFIKANILNWVYSCKNYKVLFTTSVEN